MNTIKISAVLTAALLTGALSATAFAAETLTTTTGSITFRKAIDVTNAAGAGGITGTIAFDVTAADESDLPDDGEKNYVGSVDQLDGSDIIATFAADDSGIANKESDVSVGFDTSKFEAPGIYYYHLTERDPGIHGLTATTATYLLKVRVVNDNTSDPDGTTFKIDYATLTSLDDNTKSDLITNTYTTHGLTVTKALAGDWADYTDHFIFTLEITDPDANPGRMASVTVFRAAVAACVLRPARDAAVVVVVSQVPRLAVDDRLCAAPAADGFAGVHACLPCGSCALVCGTVAAFLA